MLYVLAITLLLSGAAVTAERAARLRRARTRWIWAVTIAASLGVPVLVASVSIQLPSLLTPTIARRVTALRELTSVQVVPLTWVYEHTGDIVATSEGNQLLQRAWIAVSAALLAALAVSGAYVKWCKRHWRMSTVAGTRVFIAPHVGPAVVGLLRPRVVIPEWLLGTSPSCRAMALGHEQAHLAGRDSQLLMLALCLVVLMPWNLPLWWQLHRLRHAIEVDCDARVLQSGADSRLYREVLIEVAERPTAYVATMAAVSEPRSFLKERIRLMARDRGKWRAVSAVAFGSTALVLVAVAAQVAPPNFGSFYGTRQPVILAPAALDRLVGYYQRGSHAVRVTRDGTRLLMEVPHYDPKIPHYDPGELVPDSEGNFTGTVGGNPITFVQDAQGRTTGFVTHVGTSITIPWVRVDARVAETILAATEAKYRNRTPTPGSEAALRRVIDGVLSGEPNYTEMTPWFAEWFKQQIASTPMFRPYAPMGAVRSIEFRGVGRGGDDVYEVRQEGGPSTWNISLDSNGFIDGVGAIRW
jgi:hypothetical protein